MPTFTGTTGNDYILPWYISSGVIAVGGTLPGAGADTLNGGDGADMLGGGGGSDAILAGAGNDTVVWSPGDGFDKVDGGAGYDVASLEADGAANFVAVRTNNGDHGLVQIDGVTAMDTDNLEQLSIVTWDGPDTVQVSDMTATEVQLVWVDLQGYSSVIDFAPDTVIVNGSATSANTMAFGMGSSPLSYGNPSTAEIVNTVLGRTTTTRVSTLEALDKVTFNGGAAADTMTIYNAPHLEGLTVNGGGGDDTINWRPSVDDTSHEVTSIFGGTGVDLLNIAGWLPGGPVNFTLSATAGGHAGLSMFESRLGPDIFHSITHNDLSLDIAGIENLKIVGSGQADGFYTFFSFDNFTIGNLAGTGIKTVDIDLPALGEQVSVEGTANADTITVTVPDTGAGVTFNGLPATVILRGADVDASHGYSLSTGGGNDKVDVSASVHIGLQIGGGLGFDSLAGGAFADTLAGGEDADTINGRGGEDLLYGGTGADVFVVGAGGSAIAAPDRILDWEPTDKIDTVGPSAVYGVEGTAANATAALAYANSQIAGGADVVSVQVGSNVMVFFEGSVNDGVANEAILLVGRALLDVSAVNFI